MLILLVFSYLVPKEEYKKYIQFFVGIFIVVMLVKPVFEIMSMNNTSAIYEIFEKFNNQIEALEYEVEEGESIFEYFIFEDERE